MQDYIGLIVFDRVFFFDWVEVVCLYDGKVFGLNLYVLFSIECRWLGLDFRGVVEDFEFDGFG